MSAMAPSTQRAGGPRNFVSFFRKFLYVMVMFQNIIFIWTVLRTSQPLTSVGPIILERYIRTSPKMPEYYFWKVSYPGIYINFEVCSFCPVWENILTIFERRENEVCFVISAGFELWKSDIALGCPAVQRDKVERESENKDIGGAKKFQPEFHVQIWKHGAVGDVRSFCCDFKERV